MLADSNIWLALALSKHDLHKTARAWLDKCSQSEVVFCRATQQSFLRLLTTAAVLSPYGIPPLTNKAAWTVYADFRADRRVAWTDEPSGLESQWRKYCQFPAAAPKLWMDAFLAAFAVAGRQQLVTTDKGFKQFKGLDLLVLE
ncbi:MAG TPA: TA system VapC family ribonuclease toxin [Gemmataceae bacterium]|nr:TA system VapC family ribonuclease toxin [Gemmataceae bacterium]